MEELPRARPVGGGTGFHALSRGAAPPHLHVLTSRVLSKPHLFGGFFGTFIA